MLAALARDEIERAGIPALDLFAVGDLRRHAPEVAGVALLAVCEPDRCAAVLRDVTRLPMVTSVTEQSARHVAVGTPRGALVLHATEPDSAGAALVWLTGSRGHVAQLSARARRLGLALDAGRLRRASGETVYTPDEGACYRLLDLPLVPPELREGEDEIEAAERGLPPLVATVHVRGDLHMHSTWSDGRDSIRRMARAAQRLGYEYVAITDHSERAMASRRLLALEIPIQREEIDRVRAEIPGLRVLHGVEVDILEDGSLDFGDEDLAQFDFVLASLHEACGHTGDRLTERYLAAMRHPLVNVVTHPANRSPGLSPGYDLDYDRLFEAAIETGTAMEVDGSPVHLDMDGRVARRAAAAGVTILISSDSHRADALGRQMRFGIGTARRGWVGPDSVLNARDTAAVEAFVARKRTARG
jgi:DNA polymerase (family 10)